MYKALSEPDKPVHTRKVFLPTDFTTKIPLKAQLWIKKYGINDLEIEMFGFGWSDAYERLILPVYNELDFLIYWQGRTFKEATKTNPKYLNIRQAGAKHVYFRRNRSIDGSYYRSIVIVEDIISAIKCGRHTNSLALLGSYIPSSIVSILQDYEKIYIWLDNDKYSTSIKEAIKLSKILGKPVIPINTKNDPKEIPDDEISTLLTLR